MEMAGIDQIDAEVLCVPELVVLDIGGDKGIAAGSLYFQYAATATLRTGLPPST